jgi:hypothetical protein
LYKTNVEIKCQLDATDVFYCRSYCLLNMLRAPLCPTSGARAFYTVGSRLWSLVLGFQVVSMAAARKPDTQPSDTHHTDNLKTKHQRPQAATNYNTLEFLMMGLMVPEIC